MLNIAFFSWSSTDMSAWKAVGRFMEWLMVNVLGRYKWVLQAGHLTQTAVMIWHV